MSFDSLLFCFYVIALRDLDGKRSYKHGFIIIIITCVAKIVQGLQFTYIQDSYLKKS